MSHIARKFLAPIAAGIVLFAATSAWAVADAGAKARGDFSGRGNIGSSAFYSAPMVRTPVLANQNAGERRMLSVEPSAPATKKSDVTVKKDATPAKKDTTTRSYSVEPTPAPRSYSVPSRSSTPLYLLPKSDSRKFGG